MIEALLLDVINLSHVMETFRKAYVGVAQTALTSALKKASRSVVKYSDVAIGFTSFTKFFMSYIRLDGALGPRFQPQLFCLKFYDELGKANARNCDLGAILDGQMLSPYAPDSEADTIFLESTLMNIRAAEVARKLDEQERLAKKDRIAEERKEAKRLKDLEPKDPNRQPVPTLSRAQMDRLLDASAKEDRDDGSSDGNDEHDVYEAPRYDDDIFITGGHVQSNNILDVLSGFTTTQPSLANGSAVTKVLTKGKEDDESSVSSVDSAESR